MSSTLLGIAALGLSLLVGALVLSASGAVDDALGRAALHFSVIAAPVATGLYAVRSRGSERFGRMLIVVGLLWSLTILGESSDSLVYSVGRVSAWFVVPLLVYVMLIFPEGRLTRRRDLVLFRSVLLLVAALFVASALVTEDYPTQTPWASCVADCPANAFLVPDAEPAFVDAVLMPVREAVAVLLLLAVTLSLAVRMRATSTIRRVETAPVLAASILAALTIGVFLFVRRVFPDSDLPHAIGVAFALCLPAIAAAFSLGLLQRRLFIGTVLGDLSLGMRSPSGPGDLGAALRSAIGDPGVRVLVRERDRWVGEDGATEDPAAITADGRTVHRIGGERDAVAALVLDADLDADDELIAAISSLTEAALRETSLQAELEDSLSDLDDSRRRIATAAELERRRIERDLHDGAQQRLIALRMRLSLAEDLLRDDPGSAPDTLHDIGDDVDAALDEIRSLAQGIYPALLADRGLADALTSVGRACPIAVAVDASGVSRHAPELESAVYFSCVESLQNVVKHARGATRARVSLRQNHVLRFEVGDDGQGFDQSDVANGAGMRNMRDRIEALGGTLEVTSSRGRGTVVRGTVPLVSPGAPQSATRGATRG